MNNWKHTKTTVEGEVHAIKGINIWDHAWLGTGVIIPVKDPLYTQDFLFHVYRIEEGGIPIEFAAGEFSNGVWGIYEREE